MAAPTGEQWVEHELADGLAVSIEDAARIVVAHRSAGRTLDIGPAATLVSLARAVRIVPAARLWWAANRERSVPRLLRGASGDVEAWLGEAVAPPAPDVMDFQWPAYKVFRVVDIPAGLNDGEEFLVGDGMGGRAWMRVAERVGTTGAEVARCVQSPLDDLFDDALADARRRGFDSPFSV